MPSLRETQLAFASSVLGSEARCMEGLVLERGFSTEERVRVYRNNARIGFHQALRAGYPVIELLGGPDWFESAAQRYQQQHPSRRGDLQYVGDRFAEFLRADLSGTPYEWFVEVARLEWAYQEVLVAPESPILDPGVLSCLTALQLEQVVIVPRTELRLVVSTLPVLGIWKAHRTEALPEEVRVESGERHTLLLRRADHVELREIAATQSCLLAALLGGVRLLGAQQRFSTLFPEADFGASLTELFRFGALSSIRITNH